jgi:hypothetical protein
MDFHIAVYQEPAATYFSQVAELPGALVQAQSARTALMGGMSLALRIVADHIASGELQEYPLSVRFETESGSRGRLALDAMRARVMESVKATVAFEVGAEVGQGVFDPVQNAVGGAAADARWVRCGPPLYCVLWRQ